MSSVNERTWPSVAGDGEAERVVAVDERAREVVGVDLAPLVVEVLEDLLGDDAPLDVDVEEGRLRQHLAEERARRVERLGRQREREDAVVDLRRREERPAEALEREVDLVGARDARRSPVDHVLEEMADAVVLGRSRSASRRAPRARRGRGGGAAAARRRTGSPLARTALRMGAAAVIEDSVLVLVFGAARRSAVGSGLLDVGLVDLDRVLRLVAQPRARRATGPRRACPARDLAGTSRGSCRSLRATPPCTA